MIDALTYLEVRDLTAHPHYVIQRSQGPRATAKTTGVHAKQHDTPR